MGGTDDFFFFQEIGIQQSFPKYPKSFVKVFEEKAKDVLGLYFRPVPGTEQELYDTYSWTKKSDIKGWSYAIFTGSTDMKVVEQLIDTSYQVVLGTLTKTEQRITESLKDEMNNFQIFDALAKEFENPAKYIFRSYGMTIDIGSGAECYIRFEDNAIIEWKSRERERHKDPAEWRVIIEKAINNTN